MRRTALAIAVIALTACPTAAAQAPLPPLQTVARVGDELILRSSFDRWLDVAAGRGVTPDPPRYRRCIADRRAPGRSRPRRALRAACVRQYKELRREVLTFLIQSRWTELEAAARGIRVDRRTVGREVTRQRRLAFESLQEYRQYLRVTGLRPWVIRYRVRQGLLSERLQSQTLATVPPPAEAELRAYYEANRDGFVGLTYEQVRARIAETILSDRQTAAIDAFLDDFRARYREQTTCSRGFVISGVCNRRP